MKITETIKDRLQRLKHKASDITASEEEPVEKEENTPETEQDTSMQENPDGYPDAEENNSGIDESDDMSEADRATMLRKKHIMTGIGCVGLFVAAMVGSNVLFKGAPAKQVKDPPLNSTQVSDERASTPANGMPAKYSDITKYAEKNQKANAQKSSAIQPKSNTAKNSSNSNASSNSNRSSQSNTGSQRTTTSRPSNNGGTTVASNNGYSRQQAEALKAAKEAQKAEQEALTSAIAFTQVVTGNSKSSSGNQAGAGAVAMATTQPAVATLSSRNSYFEEPDDTINGQYALQAGSVIQATLITGITSDMPSGDVVAQVRQNIYDSLTGEHLLIPQGSKLIGKSGSAGSRGNARIGVTFERIILPTGESITLPNQKAIDGVGYLGMKDQYTEHTGKLFGTGIMTALIAAAAQSATGNSSGSDNRSPGQEAVAGAVSEVLDTMKTIIDRQGNVSPTITIRPGFEFSVFINQDLYIPEYESDL